MTEAYSARDVVARGVELIRERFGFDAKLVDRWIVPVDPTTRGRYHFRKEARVDILKSVLVAFVLLGCSVPAMADDCEAQYTQTQCEQLGGGDQPPTPGGGTSCPYYMCGNATTGAQDAVDWCEATQTYTNCPIFFCRQDVCVGTNCYVTGTTCSSCSSRAGNNAHLSDCPRQ